MKNILFICTGNTCRSPMAEGFMKAALAKDPELSSRFCTSSAGITSYAGDRASSNSIEVMLSNWKIDIARHTAVSLNKKEVSEAFLILTMTRHQKGSVIASYPEAGEKIYTLKEFTCINKLSANNTEYDCSLDITDPYGKPLHEYYQCASEIKEAVDDLLQKL